MDRLSDRLMTLLSLNIRCVVSSLCTFPIPHMRSKIIGFRSSKRHEALSKLVEEVNALSPRPKPIDITDILKQAVDEFFYAIRKLSAEEKLKRLQSNKTPQTGSD